MNDIFAEILYQQDRPTPHYGIDVVLISNCNVEYSKKLVYLITS